MAGIDTAWIGLAISSGVLIAGTVRYFHVQLQEIREDFDKRMDELEKSTDKSLADYRVDREKVVGNIERLNSWNSQMHENINAYRREVAGHLKGALAVNQSEHEAIKLDMKELWNKVISMDRFLAKFTSGTETPYKQREERR